MRYLFVLALLATACNSAGPKMAKDTAARQPVVFTPKESAKILLDMYEELPPFDTLDLGGGPEYGENGIVGRYKGKPLGVRYARMLPESLTGAAPGVIDGEEYSEFQYFACYRFPINGRLTGLITRTPGEYDITKLSLLFYDHAADTVGYAFDLVDNWGDAGDAVSYRSWLIRNARTVDCWMAVNSYHDGEDLEDSLYESGTDYFKTDLAARTLDTSYKNKPEWAPVFKRLIGEKNYEEPDSVYVNKHSSSSE